MITFNTQEEFDAAVMAVVEKYLQIKVSLGARSETNYNHPQTSIVVALKNNLSQTTFWEVDDVVDHYPA
jgi:hypothetical protein